MSVKTHCDKCDKAMKDGDEHEVTIRLMRGADRVEVDLCVQCAAKPFVPLDVMETDGASLRKEFQT